MDSSDMTITYKAICDRAIDDAKGYAPGFPKGNTIEAWESFMDDIEGMESFDIAHESCDWDWVIYSHRALELCQVVPSSVLYDAEDQLEGMGGMPHDKLGPYELACQLAAIIVTNEIAQAVEQVKEELTEMAQTQLDQLDQLEES